MDRLFPFYYIVFNIDIFNYFYNFERNNFVNQTKKSNKRIVNVGEMI